MGNEIARRHPAIGKFKGTVCEGQRPAIEIAGYTLQSPPMADYFSTIFAPIAALL